MKVSVVVHTPDGEIIAKTKDMTLDQLDELRHGLGYKLVQPSYYLDLDTESGFVIIPHDVMVKSVIQVVVTE